MKNTPLGRILVRYLMLAGAELGAKASGFALMVMIVRHFGPAGFGQISFASSIMACALMLGAGGLDVFAVRTLARAPSSAAMFVRTIIGLRLALGLGVYLGLLALTLVVPAFSPVAGLLALFGLSLFTSSVSLTWVPEGLQRTGVLALVNLATPLLSLTLLIGMLRWGGGLWAIPLAQLAAEGLVALGLGAWTWNVLGRFQGLLPRKDRQGMLKQAAPIGGSRLIRAITIGSDVFLLGSMVSMEKLGWYTGAYRLYILSISLGGLYFVILFPRLTCKVEDQKAFVKELGTSILVILGIAIPGAILGGVLARKILETLFDPSFGVASTSLRILLLGWVVSLVAGHFRFALLAQKQERRDFQNVLASCGLHLGSKLLLIPLLGIVGAALGSLAGEMCLAAMSWVALRRHFSQEFSDNTSAGPPWLGGTYPHWQDGGKARQNGCSGTDLDRSTSNAG